MDLKQLSVFKAVMNAGSTIAAGSALQMSQSAISRQLAALEQELGFPLFHREKGRLVPTSEALALVGEAGDLVERLARLRRRADDIRAGAAGETFIKAAFPHSMTTTILPGIVREFLAEEPKAIVELLSGPYDVIEQFVTDRVADIGFVRLPTEQRGFNFQPLVTSSMVCVMPRGHALAARKIVDVKDVAAADLVLLGRQRIQRGEFEAQLRAIRPTIRCRVETHSVETSCAMVEAGLGISIVPALIANFFSRMAIELRPLRPEITHQYGIISPPGTPVSRPVSRLASILRKALLGHGSSAASIADPVKDAVRES
jgi:DNA-binding transcriptional LysR family regulator